MSTGLHLISFDFKCCAYYCLVAQDVVQSLITWHFNLGSLHPLPPISSRIRRSSCRSMDMPIYLRSLPPLLLLLVKGLLINANCTTWRPRVHRGIPTADDNDDDSMSKWQGQTELRWQRNTDSVNQLNYIHCHRLVGFGGLHSLIYAKTCDSMGQQARRSGLWAFIRRMGPFFKTLFINIFQTPSPPTTCAIVFSVVLLPILETKPPFGWLVHPESNWSAVCRCAYRKVSPSQTVLSINRGPVGLPWIWTSFT